MEVGAGVMARGKRDRLDPTFRALTASSAAVILALMGGVVWQLWSNSGPAWERFGLGFLFSQEWDPVLGDFGAASSIFGTLMSTVVAMALAAPMSVAIALFLVEMAPPTVAKVVGGGVELLAAIPSIIYGMWGLFVFAPFMADHVQPAAQRVFGSTPVLNYLLAGPPIGIGMGTAGIILALMVLPYISAVMRDVFAMVPSVVKESAYGMGSTTWEVTRKVTLPYGSQGIVGACFLGLGRALGETMAVTFVIGNAHRIHASLLAPGNSIASTLANEFVEADDPLYRSVLIELGLVLLAMTLVIQILAQLWLGRLRKRMGGGL